MSTSRPWPSSPGSSSIRAGDEPAWAGPCSRLPPRTPAAGDLHPVLDVVTRFDPAVAFYRSCGWRNAGEVTLAFDDGEELQSYVFVGPA